MSDTSDTEGRDAVAAPGSSVPAALDQRLEVPPHVYSRPFGDQIVLLDFGQGDYYGLDEVGAVLFRTAEHGGSVRDAVLRVVSDFEGATSEQATVDLLALADEMLKQGLLSHVPATEKTPGEAEP